MMEAERHLTLEKTGVITSRSLQYGCVDLPGFTISLELQQPVVAPAQSFHRVTHRETVGFDENKLLTKVPMCQEIASKSSGFRWHGPKTIGAQGRELWTKRR